jgi:hypothetical protein
LKKGLEEYGALALFCTLSPAGRWTTRGSKSLIEDPAFPVIKKQLQRLAMSRYELRAARNEIYRNDMNRRRMERAAGGEASVEQGATADAPSRNQRQPSKELRTFARRLWNTPAFQQKLKAVRSAYPALKACDKQVCRIEHLDALAEAPCYPLRQAMGWPDKVPFTSAVGELTTRELADFVATFRAYENLQPMHEEQEQQAEPEQRTTRDKQVPTGM